MPIPPVRLNIDPAGYAGPIVPPLQTPDVYGGRGRSPLYGLLEQRARIQNAMAAKQLQMMQEDINRQRLERRGMKSPLRLGVQMPRVQGPLQQAAPRGDPREMLLGEALRGVSPSRTGMRGMGMANYINVLRGMQGEGGATGIAPYVPPELLQAELEAARGQAAPYPEPGMSGSYRAGWRPSTMLKKGSLPGPPRSGHGHPYFKNAPAQFKHGTLPGTLKKNQKAKLHEGEVVISADQVDEPLMAYLMNDKLRKLRTGQMDGKGTGPGAYRGGTLGAKFTEMPGYQEGSLWERFNRYAEDVDRAALTRLNALLYGSRPAAMERGFRGFGESARDIIPARGEKAPEPRKPDEEMSVKEWLATYGPGAGPDIDYLTEDWEPRWPVMPTIPTPSREAVGIPGAPFEGPERRAADVLGTVAQQEEEFLKGAKERRETAATEAAEEQERQRIEEATARQEASLQEALARVRRGDLGTREAPLMLRGDPSIPLQEAFNTAAALREGETPEQFAARGKAEHERFMTITNRSKAERIQDFLASPTGSEMDPQQARILENQAKFLLRQSETIEERQFKRDERAKDRMAELEKAMTVYRSALAKAEATATVQTRREQATAERDLRRNIFKLEEQIREGHEEGYSEETILDLIRKVAQAEFELRGDVGDEDYEAFEAWVIEQYQDFL